MRYIIFSAVLLTAGAAAANPIIDRFDRLIKETNGALMNYHVDAAQATWAQACVADLPRSQSLWEIASCEHEAGAIAEALERDTEAAAHYVKAAGAWEKLGTEYVPNRIITLSNLGNVYRRLHRLPEAEQTFTRALELTGALPTGLRAKVLSRAADVYGELGQPARARAFLEQSIAALQGGEHIDMPELAAAFDSLGMLELSLGRYKAGENNLREALKMAEATLGEESPETAAYMTNLALALLLEGQSSGAESLLRRARFVIEAKVGANSMRLVTVLAELSTADARLGRFRTAEECSDKALAILNSHLPAGSQEIVLTEVNLATLYLREHKLVEAEKILPAAIAAERAFFKEGRTLADGLRDLAELRVQQHVWGDAEALYQEALGFYERSLGAEHPDLAPVLREYAGVLKHQKAARAQIRETEARARAIENSSAQLS
jgi:tetratricopeptide (TPR) repeat protein